MPPLKNLLTDIAGVRVGHAEDAKLASGTTAIIFDSPAVAAIDVRGGGPGTREVSLLDVANTVERVDAITLSGGSAFGLDSAGGVQAWLAEQGRGFRIREAVIPVVPGAIVFDLLNGGDKAWGRFSPYRDLGYAAAAAAAAGNDFALGSVGAGLGATTATLKGGPWFGLGDDAERRQGRRHHGRQRSRQRHRRHRPLVLGRAVRAER
ncbi:L-aminopeptidase/D-esterase-like protein [Bradyrhizobium sp. LM2.7]